MSRFRALALLLMIMWIVEAVNLVAGYRLNALGLVPRSLAGIPGIAIAPLLHASVTHLVSNSAGLLILGGLVAVAGERHFIRSSVAIALLGGAGVWLFGRPALHIGASGLVFGYFGFLVADAWYRRTLATLVIALVAIFLYGSALWGLLPLRQHISWEAHIAGFAAGAIVAKWRRAPAP